MEIRKYWEKRCFYRFGFCGVPGTHKFGFEGAPVNFNFQIQSPLLAAWDLEGVRSRAPQLWQIPLVCED